jgi:hypothetical protein
MTHAHPNEYRMVLITLALSFCQSYFLDTVSTLTMANPVRLFRLGVSVILLLGSQPTPVAVASNAARGTDVDEYVDENDAEDNDEDYDYDRDDDVKAAGFDADALNSTITCDHGICRDNFTLSLEMLNTV